MITIDITPEQIERAEKHYDFKSLKGSIMKGESNIYGALGEIVVHDYFSKLYDCELCNTYDYDLIIKNHKVDVKTKRTTVKPQPHYNCSLFWNTKQKCDFYYFVRVLENKTKAFILGYISKEAFYEKATKCKGGESENEYFKFKSDGYNLPISELNKFRTK